MGRKKGKDASPIWLKLDYSRRLAGYNDVNEFTTKLGISQQCWQERAYEIGKFRLSELEKIAKLCDTSITITPKGVRILANKDVC